MAALGFGFAAFGGLIALVGVEDGEAHAVQGGVVVAAFGVGMALFFALRRGGRRLLFETDAAGLVDFTAPSPLGRIPWAAIQGVAVVYNRGTGHVRLTIDPAAQPRVGPIARFEGWFLGGPHVISTASMSLSAEDLAAAIEARRAYFS